MQATIDNVWLKRASKVIHNESKPDEQESRSADLVSPWLWFLSLIFDDDISNCDGFGLLIVGARHGFGVLVRVMLYLTYDTQPAPRSGNIRAMIHTRYNMPHETKIARRNDVGPKSRHLWWSENRTRSTKLVPYVKRNRGIKRNRKKSDFTSIAGSMWRSITHDDTFSENCAQKKSNAFWSVSIHKLL